MIIFLLTTVRDPCHFETDRAADKKEKKRRIRREAAKGKKDWRAGGWKLQEWDYGRLHCRIRSTVWRSQRGLVFMWSHKTKELPVTNPGPLTAMLDGGWSVREWQCVVCVWVGRQAAQGGFHKKCQSKRDATFFLKRRKKKTRLITKKLMKFIWDKGHLVVMSLITAKNLCDLWICVIFNWMTCI